MDLIQVLLTYVTHYELNKLYLNRTERKRLTFQLE